MEFNKADWYKRLDQAKTGEELIALAWELPEKEHGQPTTKDAQESSTTEPPMTSKRSI